MKGYFFKIDGKIFSVYSDRSVGIDQDFDLVSPEDLTKTSGAFHPEVLVCPVNGLSKVYAKLKQWFADAGDTTEGLQIVSWEGFKQDPENGFHVEQKDIPAMLHYGRVVRSESMKYIVVEEGFRVPGTSVLVEKGDRIEIKSSSLKETRNRLRQAVIVKQSIGELMQANRNNQDTLEEIGKELAFALWDGVLEIMEDVEGTHEDRGPAFMSVFDGFFEQLKKDLRTQALDFSDF